MATKNAIVSRDPGAIRAQRLRLAGAGRVQARLMWVTDQLDRGDEVATVIPGQESVDADQGQRAVVLPVLVVQVHFLDLAALVLGPSRRARRRVG